MKTIATFSIAAYDPEAQEWGVAVQSKFLACASAVCFAKAGAGVIATQANANLDYGELGLKLLEKGYSAQQVLDALVAGASVESVLASVQALPGCPADMAAQLDAFIAQLLEKRNAY